MPGQTGQLKTDISLTKWCVVESLYKAGAIFPMNLPLACMVRTAVRLRFKCYLHIMFDESRTIHIPDRKTKFVECVCGQCATYVLTFVCACSRMFNVGHGCIIFIY